MSWRIKDWTVGLIGEGARFVSGLDWTVGSIGQWAREESIDIVKMYIFPCRD